MCPLMLIRAPVDSAGPVGSLYYPALCVINWSHYRNWERLANCLSVIDDRVGAAPLLCHRVTLGYAAMPGGGLNVYSSAASIMPTPLGGRWKWA